MQKNDLGVQPARQKHPLAEKLAKGKGSARNVSGTKNGAVQKKQSDSDKDATRSKAFKSMRATASVQIKAAKSVIVAQAKQEKAERIRKQLNELYPNPPIPLDHQSHFQLLVAVMLSAQVHFLT
jgi:hypothetical protein